MICVLGTRIATLRSQLGMSQAQLARRLNISPSAVGMYEQGRREPSADILVALSRVLGVSLEYLMTGCQSSQEASPFRPGGGPQSAARERSLIDTLRVLSREELLVLLTAELIGSDSDEA